MWTVNEVSKRTGVSIRTLQYYDKIGLLHPAQYTQAGYRLYDEKGLERLQQILLFRELTFSLKEIEEILQSPDFDREKALDQQIEMLTMKKEHLENLITFARGLKQVGGNTMNFSAFDTQKMERYAAEAKKQWQNTSAYQAFAEKSKGRSKEAEEALGRGLMMIFEDFGRCRDVDPALSDAQALVKRLQGYITENYYPCTKEILNSLGEMYAAGGEFTENINKAALLQARRLMAEHKLMPEDIEPQENKNVIQECVGVTCTKPSSPWTVYLSTLIAAHYCCRPYRSSVHGSKVSEIGFIGMEDDFKLCKLAFLYAYDCVASRCRQIRTQKGYPAKTLREMCNSYGWGFCRGLSAAFQKQEAEHQEWGLVMVVPQAVEDAVSKMKRSSYKISPQSSINRQYAAMGYADGQEFDMRRRLEPSA